ncbi:unnamed protein product [Echinostoma caproni]|uniref:Integrase n=1 Tax=Echinostoma caproni TaxID=27848 RepID=A0A183B8X8_9TREM|nr:unnamed protein product [Echinostoma caproni]
MLVPKGISNPPTDSTPKRGFTWSDVHFLRSAWLEKREPLQSLIDRLTLDSLIKATVQGPGFSSFRSCIHSAFGLGTTTVNDLQSADHHNTDENLIVNYLSDEPDLFNAGLDFVTVDESSRPRLPCWTFAKPTRLMPNTTKRSHPSNASSSRACGMTAIGGG